MIQYYEDGKDYRSCYGLHIDVGELAEGILGSEWSYAAAFTYLYRRFGPTFYGGDPYKDLACYFLTTKMKGVLLYVRPCVSTQTSFGVSVSMQLRQKIDAEHAYCEWKRRKGLVIEPKRPLKIKKALEDAIRDLNRSTHVRDWYFNILGETEPNDDSVSYSNLSGYGITPDYYEKFKKAGK